MKLYSGWDEQTYKSICRASGSKQAIKDASYMRPVQFRGADIYAERVDDIACIFGYFNKKNLHIVCTAVSKVSQKNGIGSMLLIRAIQAAQYRRCEKISTRTKDGLAFYQRHGFNVVGMKNGDYIMEAVL